LKSMVALIRSYFMVFLADRAAVALTFIVPIFMIFIFGEIFGGSHPESSGIRLAFLNLSNAPVAKKIETTLDSMSTFTLVRTSKNKDGVSVPFDTLSIQDFVRRGNAPAALVLPVDAFTDTSVGLKVCLYYDPRNDFEMQIVQGMLQKTIMQEAPQVFMQSMMRQAEKKLGKAGSASFSNDIQTAVNRHFPGAHFTTDSMLSLATTNGGTSDSVGRGIVKNMVDIRMEQLVGKDISNPMPTRSVGGWAMMFLLFTLSSVANVLIDERRNAVFVRHLAAPFSRGQILLSRYIYSTILGIIQLVVLFLAGTLLFGIDIFSNAGNLLLVIVFAAAAATGFGMLIASIARTAAQASALGLVLILSMSAIGGAWFPTTFMPATIQALSKLTIVYWSMEAFMVVLWRHGGFLDVAPYLGVLAGIAAVVTALSVWRFSKGQVLL